VVSKGRKTAARCRTPILRSTLPPSHGCWPGRCCQPSRKAEWAEWFITDIKAVRLRPLLHWKKGLTEIARGHNLNAFERAQPQQIIIAGYDDIRFRFEGALENLVIVRIRARVYGPCRLDNFSS
jgi:hypothetical protein